MTVWYVLENNEVRQITDNAFRLQLSSGHISPKALLWTEGMQKWTAASELLRPATSPSKTPELYPLVFFVVLVACLSLWSTAAREALLGRLIELVGLTPAIAIIVLISVLLAALASFLAMKAWNYPARRKASKSAGLLFLVAGISAFCQVIILCAFLVQAPDVYWMLTAVEDYTDASITNAGEGSAIIAGTIGPHLVRDFMKLQEVSGPITTVQITSSRRARRSVDGIGPLL